MRIDKTTIVTITMSCLTTFGCSTNPMKMEKKVSTLLPPIVADESEYLNLESKRLKRRKNKDLGISRESIRKQLNEKMLSISPEKPEIIVAEGMEIADIYRYANPANDFVRLDYKQTDKNAVVKRILLTGNDLDKFPEVERILFDTIFPDLTDADYLQIKSYLHKLDKTESIPYLRGEILVRSWSEYNYKNKSFLLTEIFRKSANGKDLSKQLRLNIDPD